jgi:hypothetical protein
MAEHSGKEIRAENLAGEIYRQLREYTDEVKETIYDIAMDVSARAVERLQSESPKRTGKYRKKWTRTTDRNGIIIHQSGKTYRLTHLLEKGHALRRGGRKTGESPAYPHIEKVERECVTEFLTEIERGLGH